MNFSANNPYRRGRQGKLGRLRNAKIGGGSNQTPGQTVKQPQMTAREERVTARAVNNFRDFQQELSSSSNAVNLKNIPSILKRKNIDKEIVTIKKPPKRQDLGFGLYAESKVLNAPSIAPVLENELPTEEQQNTQAEADSSARNMEAEEEINQPAPVSQTVQADPQAADPSVKKKEEAVSVPLLSTSIISGAEEQVSSVIPPFKLPGLDPNATPIKDRSQSSQALAVYSPPSSALDGATEGKMADIDAKASKEVAAEPASHSSQALAVYSPPSPSLPATTTAEEQVSSVIPPFKLAGLDFNTTPIKDLSVRPGISYASNNTVTKVFANSTSLADVNYVLVNNPSVKGKAHAITKALYQALQNSGVAELPAKAQASIVHGITSITSSPWLFKIFKGATADLSSIAVDVLSAVGITPAMATGTVATALGLMHQLWMHKKRLASSLHMHAVKDQYIGNTQKELAALKKALALSKAMWQGDS
jgi:hypothetical protein